MPSPKFFGRDSYDLDEIMWEFEKVDCEHPSLKPSLGPIDYRGSALGAFNVPKACTFKCEACGSIFYSRVASRRWEIKELERRLSADSSITTQEAQFIREVFGFSQKELARLLGVDRSTIFRWETERISASNQQLLRFFALLAILVEEMRSLSDDDSVSACIQQRLEVG